MEMQNRQVAMSEYGAGLIDPMTYYEAAGYENGTEIKQRLIEEAIRNLPAVREKIETAVAQEMGLIDEENQAAAAEQITQRQQAMAPQVPGVNGAGPTDLNTALTPDTFNPTRIDLG
jgi:hypothetical protein